MILRPAILGFAIAFLALPAAAENEADIERLRETGICPGCDLAGADLQNLGFGEDIGPIDLRGADLTRANLLGADLTNANLEGANLEGAQLDTAILTGASLRDANLTNASGAFADFTGADLAGALMVGFIACYDQSFRNADLRGVDARGAVLCGGVWTDALLAGADFRGADLTLAVGLTQDQLNGACTDTDTQLDAGLVATANCDGIAD